MKSGYSLISLDDYLDIHLQSNPNEDREEVRERIEGFIEFKKEGGHCHCGKAIWVVGSSAAQWPGCFSHITGESYPDEDYEIEF